MQNALFGDILIRMPSLIYDYMKKRQKPLNLAKNAIFHIFDTGFTPLTAGSRGPICYSCDQQLNPDTCHIIKECGRDEVVFFVKKSNITDLL